MAEVRKKYFIQQFMHLKYLHGGIGCVDAEKILLRNGFVPLLFPYHESFTLRAKVSRIIFLLRTALSFKGNTTLVFIFPLYARMDRWLISLLRRKRNIQVVCLIADINGLKDGNPVLLDTEIHFFKHFRYFIVHNASMRDWLKARIPLAKTGIIEFFDFLTPPVDRQRIFTNQVVFAGNLDKSGFLAKLPSLQNTSPRIHFHLYGSGMDHSIIDQPNITYHGVYDPYELPGQLEGSFGLLWDGEGIKAPTGSLGDYMQYISHHKLSLYIISKLPIIAPASAASAPLIIRYGIGIIINDLNEIEEKIAGLAPKEYLQMQHNMHGLAEKISKGLCLEQALNEIGSL